VSDDTGPEGYPSLDAATGSMRRYPARDLFNKEQRQEKKDRQKAVKAELKDKIQPRPTYAQRQQKIEKKAKREAKEAKREGAVTERLMGIHSGAPLNEVVQLGSDLLYLSVLSGMQLQINEQLSTGEKCFSRWTVYGRHEQEFLGMAPTNREVTFGGVSVSFLVDDKITQEIHYWDMVALLQQIQAT
jgi:hypothetical protein